MEFLDTERVYYLLIPLLLGVLVALRARRTETMLSRFKIRHDNLESGTPEQGGQAAKTRWIPVSRLFLLLALAVITFGLMRPYFGFQTLQQDISGADLIVLMDVSRSMNAQDTKPSRIVFAKRKLHDLIDQTERHSYGDRIGIVLFAGTSFLYCPLTSDYGVIHSFVDEISTALISYQGTDLHGAFENALQAFSEVKSESPRILLITDGEDSKLDTPQLAAGLRAAKAKLAILGVGTTVGAPIPTDYGDFLKDNSGKTVVSRLGEDALSRLAAAVHGDYQHGSLGMSDLNRIQSFFADGKTSSFGQKEIRVYNEIAHWLYLVALAMLILSLAFSRGVALPYILLPVLVFSSSQPPVEAQEILHSSSYIGHEDYSRGNYAEAEQAFRSALASSPNDPDLARRLGSSLYKQGKFKDALLQFERAEALSNSNTERATNAYNAGNAHFYLKDLSEAKNAYEKSLTFNPNDEQTKYNLALVNRLLEEQKRKDTSEKQEQQSKQDGENSEKQSKQSENKQNQPDQTQQSSEQGDKSKAGQSQEKKPDSDSKGDDSQESDNAQQQTSEESSPEDAQPSQSMDKSTESNDQTQSEKPEQSEGDSAQKKLQGEEGSDAAPHQQAKAKDRGEDGPGTRQPYNAQPNILDTLDDRNILVPRQTGRYPVGAEQPW